MRWKRIQNGSMKMIMRVTSGAIVVPWNFSENSKVALKKAMELAGKDSPIRVLHVAPPLTGPDNGALYEFAEKQTCLELEKRFFGQMTPDQRRRNITFHVEYGCVEREITRFADRYQANMIILSPRNRHGLSKYLFGRLPETLERLARCPVLVMQGTQLKNFMAGSIILKTGRSSS